MTKPTTLEKVKALADQTCTCGDVNCIRCIELAYILPDIVDYIDNLHSKLEGQRKEKNMWEKLAEKNLSVDS